MTSGLVCHRHQHARIPSDEIIVTKGGSNIPNHTVLHPRIYMSVKSAGRVIVKVGFLSIMLASAGAFAPVAAQAVAQTYQLDIPRQQLDAALKDLAQQTGLQIARFSDSPGGAAIVGPVSGNMAVADALQSLLSPSRLTYKVVNDHTIAVMTLSAASEPSTSRNFSTSVDHANESAGASKPQEGKKSSSDDFRVAQVDQGKTSGATSVGDQTSNSQQNSNGPSTGLSEIIVTAQKKSERLQDVPIPLSVVSAQSLMEQNQLRFEDYFSDFPGLNFSSGDRGELFPAIRGLTTGSYSNPTVGIVIDDVPYGASANIFSAPDIDPSDLAHIEVLRGPQGTLYGVSSIGGLIKYVTVDPSTDGYSGRVEAGTSTVYNGAKLGYNFRAAVNVPLSNTLAFRASAYSEELPGYIDNVVSGLRGVNKTTNTGGHFAALWAPADGFSVKLSALVQRSKSGGSSESVLEPSLGDLQQNLMPGQGGFQRDVTSLSATVKARVTDGVEFTSVTGYLASRLVSSLDLSTLFGPSVQPIYGVTGSGFTQWNPIDKLSQELRLSGKFGGYADWLLGGFFTDEHGLQTQHFLANNPTTGATVGLFGTDVYLYSFKEYATFGDLTVHFTDRFDVQFGGRETWDRQPAFAETTGGNYATLFLGSDPSVTNVEGASSSSFTYLVTPEFKISPDLMVYARLASGYRPGGGNDIFATLTGAPTNYGPDKTNNYEVGMKGNVRDHSLSFDLSLYRIDWQDVQLSVEDSIGNQYTINGGRAKSQGVEASVEAKPLTGSTVGAWVALNDAELTKPIPSGGAAGDSGDKLPYSTRFSGNLSLKQDFPLGNDVIGFAGAMMTYMGKRAGNFQPVGVDRQLFPSYVKTDLRAGARYQSWLVDVYLNNVANKRAELGGGVDGFPTDAIIYIQPRTAGISVSKTFK
jgi:iron complex outermembrane recepter protein